MSSRELYRSYESPSAFKRNLGLASVSPKVERSMSASSQPLDEHFYPRQLPEVFNLCAELEIGNFQRKLTRSFHVSLLSFS